MSMTQKQLLVVAGILLIVCACAQHQPSQMVYDDDIKGDVDDHENMENLLLQMYLRDLDEENREPDIYGKGGAQGFVAKRTAGARMFVGKRQDEDDNKRTRFFVGKRNEDKRTRMFVGKKNDDFDEEVKRMRMFVGKRLIEPRDNRRWFIGKRGDDKRTRMFVGKKAPLYVGKRELEEDNDNHMFIDKRGHLFIGKRFYGDDNDVEKRMRMFVGKRDEADDEYMDDEYPKRTRMFVGKRPTQFDDTPRDILDEFSRARKPDRFFVGKAPFRGELEPEDIKRTRMFVGRRNSPGFGIKEDDMDNDMDVKRTRMFVGKRRAPSFVGKRLASEFDGNDGSRDLIVKRAAISTVHGDDISLQNSVNSDGSSEADSVSGHQNTVL